MTDKLDLAINTAPTSPKDSDVGSKDVATVELNELWREKADLEDEVDRLEDELDRLNKEISIESQKARLLIPYANKVFWFCCIYTTIAFWILFLHGLPFISFKLDTSTMNFIAGSNLASVIGLIAIVAGGLFSSK